MSSRKSGVSERALMGRMLREVQAQCGAAGIHLHLPRLQKSLKFLALLGVARGEVILLSDVIGEVIEPRLRLPALYFSNQFLIAMANGGPRAITASPSPVERAGGVGALFSQMLDDVVAVRVFHGPRRQRKKRAGEVERDGHLIAHGRLERAWPIGDARYANAAFQGSLLAPKSGPFAATLEAAIVGNEYNERIVPDLHFIQHVKNMSDLRVQILEHSDVLSPSTSVQFFQH